MDKGTQEFELSYQELTPACEAILFASGEPVTEGKLAEILAVDVKTVTEVMNRIINSYESNPWGGLLVRRIDKSYVMSTKPGMMALTVVPVPSNSLTRFLAKAQTADFVTP